MGSDLLQPLEILADLAVEGVRHNLRILAILDVLLSVQKPVRNLVLARITHNGYELLYLSIKSTTKIINGNEHCNLNNG